jgi:MtN3 and saliva related transmembrane protein
MTVLGLLAATLTTLSFIPQVVHSWRGGTGRALSPWWLASFGTGLASWLGYGLMRRDPAIVASNAIMLLLVAALVASRMRDSNTTSPDRPPVGPAGADAPRRTRP